MRIFFLLLLSLSLLGCANIYTRGELSQNGVKKDYVVKGESSDVFRSMCSSLKDEYQKNTGSLNRVDCDFNPQDGSGSAVVTFSPGPPHSIVHELFEVAKRDEKASLLVITDKSETHRSNNVSRDAVVLMLSNKYGFEQPTP